MMVAAAEEEQGVVVHRRRRPLTTTSLSTAGTRQQRQLPSSSRVSSSSRTMLLGLLLLLVLPLLATATDAHPVFKAEDAESQQQPQPDDDALFLEQQDGSQLSGPELDELLALQDALEAERRAAALSRELTALEQANAFDELMDANEAREQRELERELQEAARLADAMNKLAEEEKQKQQESDKKIELEVDEADEKKEENAKEEGEEANAEVPQKKGQSEYVSFVEPPVAHQRQSKQNFDKRRPVEAVGSRNGHFLPHYNNNIVFVAIGTLLVVGVVGMVGSTLYLRRRRDSFDDSEFAPYSGTGPKLGAVVGGSAIGMPKGDEALAYKAQLHHYQQAKQKIICGDELPGVGLPDDEDDDEDGLGADEHNFSVYECPGLAPTGDLEVHNPNFDGQQH